MEREWWLVADFGPFSVEPVQIVRLGGKNFATFVSRLLAAEVAAHEMVGATLEKTYLENSPDGGVDAYLSNAPGTSWTPAGDSVWQFKSGDLAPGKCKTELKGASEALKVLRAGGSYRLVLGASLTAKKISARKDKLVEAAIEAGIEDPASRIRVLTADTLARWVEEYPALAVNPLLGATDRLGQPFEQWSASSKHGTRWVSSDERDQQIVDIRKIIGQGPSLDVHVEGLSGLGKTRLVLEAARGQWWESIVVHFGAADSFTLTALQGLQAQKRCAVLIIDECDRKQHEIYAQALLNDSTLRLITIGNECGGHTRSEEIRLTAFDDQALDELLRTNLPSLSHEATRVVVQVAAGNIDYAMKLARAAVAGGFGSAGSVITEDDLRAFFATQLPHGELLLASCALALFTRLGFDGEFAQDLELVSAGLGLECVYLRGAAAELSRADLLTEHGRFRSVSPHPVAVHLASRGWREFGPRIVDDLLPTLTPELRERLLQRAAQIGYMEKMGPVVKEAMSGCGVFASLEQVSRGDDARLMELFAVLAPGAMADQLAETIGSASEEALLQASRIRPYLVATMELLVWHSTIFWNAADLLLRLALAENEGYSNNATETWVECFGTMLPRTAASSTERIEYLSERALSDDARVRSLVVRAAAQALVYGESLITGRSRFDGTILEPRGCPQTSGEAWEYKNAALDLLVALTDDVDDSVADEATTALVCCLGDLTSMPPVLDYLGERTEKLRGDVRIALSVGIREMRSQLRYCDCEDDRLEALSRLEKTFSLDSPTQTLKVLSLARVWHHDGLDLARELAETAKIVSPEDPTGVLVDLLRNCKALPAAGKIGKALVVLGVDIDDGTELLVEFLDSPNEESIFGFLVAHVNEGRTDSFDRFIDCGQLAPMTALRIAARGVRTAAAATRIQSLLRVLPVAEGAVTSRFWMYEEDEAVSSRLLQQWGTRIASQDDYNAALDFAATQVHNKEEPLPHLDNAIAPLLPMRREYPQVGDSGYSWTNLFRRQMASSPLEALALLADCIEADRVLSAYRSGDARLLEELVPLAGEAGWIYLMNRVGNGERRLRNATEGWLGNSAKVEVAKRWVGTDVARARTLASVCKVEGDSLPPMVAFLIDDFGEDSEVQFQLRASFGCGVFSGDESDHLNAQIAMVRGWASARAESPAVKSWSRGLIKRLEADRARALKEEREENS